MFEEGLLSRSAALPVGAQGVLTPRQVFKLIISPQQELQEWVFPSVQPVEINPGNICETYSNVTCA